MIKTALLIATAGLMLSGCGPVCVCMGGPPIVEKSSPMPYDIVVTEKDHTAKLWVGHTLEVVLHAYPGMTNWSQVRSSDTSILGPIVNPAATAARGVTLAAFRVYAPGVAEITATATPDCSPGQACPALAALYTLRVTVILTG